MELKELLKTLRQRWLLALTVLWVVVAAGYAAATLPEERFTAVATLLAQPDPDRVEFGQVQVVEFLMPSIETRVESDAMSEAVEASVPPAATARAFEIAFDNEPGTGIVEIHATSPDPRAAATLANGVAELLLDDRANPELLRLTLVDAARPPSEPSSPPKTTIFVGSFVLGVIAAVFVPIAINSVNRRLGGAEEVRARFGTSVLGELPVIRRRKNRNPEVASSLLAPGNLDPAITEAFHRLRTNFELALIDEDPRAVTVTSLYTGEGKSTVTAVLSWALASAGNPVTAVDADLRRPTLHQRLGEPFGKGLSNARPGKPLAVQPTGLPDLDFLPAGDPDRHPAEVITVNLPMVIDELEARNRLVIVDAPPVVGVAETNLIAAITRAVVLVVDARQFNEPALERAIYELQQSGAKLLGVVINRAKLSREQKKLYDYYNVAPRPARHAGSESAR